MALLSSQDGVVEDRPHTHPLDGAPAGRPTLQEAKEPNHASLGVTHVTQILQSCGQFPSALKSKVRA